MIRKLLLCLRECALCRLAGLLLTPVRARIIPHRKTYLYVDPQATVTGSGRLFAGTRWKHNRFMPSQLVLHGGSTLRLNRAFRIYTGHQISVNSGATLVLGHNTYCDNGLHLACFERIEIGSDVKISENVIIRDSDNHRLDGERPSAPIMIGDRVWIGINVTILKGVTIGEGAVVAAGALVSEDVPAGALVSGVPASVVREGVTWQI